MNQYNPAKQAEAIDNVTSTSGKSAEVIDTAKIQAALEKRVDQETASLPRLTVPDIDEDPSSPDPEPAAGHTTDLSGEIQTARQISESGAGKKTFFKKRSTGHSAREGWWDPSVRSWFYTFMCMNMPVVGWFYLFHEAKHEEDPHRKEFARAYLFYKLVFFIAGLVVLLILLWIGLGLLDQLLAYMEML